MRRTSRRRTALAIAALATAATAASAHDWTNSPWGEADEIGAAKWITPERVRLAADLVTGGKTYHLGIVVDEETPAFAPRSLSVTVLQPDQMGTGGFGPTKMTYNDDIFMGWLGIGPQIDSLGHLGIDHVHYNGFEGTDFAKADGLIRPGIEKIPPMVARGVVLDMAAHFGAEIVPEGTPYTEADIRADAAQGVELREGDLVLFHSGWLNLLDGPEPDPKRYVSVARARQVWRGISGGDRRGGDRRRHPGARGRALRGGRRRVRGASDPAGQERHIHPREHGDPRARRRRRVGLHVRARPGAAARRGADDRQPDRDPVSRARGRLRRLGMGLATLAGRPRGFFSPYARAGAVVPPAGYPEIETAFRAAEPAMRMVLAGIDAHADRLAGFDGPPPEPRWGQSWFPRLDGAAAYALVRAHRPARIIEVGSGHSTRMLARAAADAGGAEMVCIDPAPRADIAQLPVTLERRMLAPGDIPRFAALAPGDIAFFDSSHLLWPGSDVDMVLNRILPALAPGVLVHIHDVFLPDPYPRGWAWRGYTEQLGLGGWLAGGGVRILFASRYAVTRLGAAANPAIARLPIPAGAVETSLWLERTGPGVR